jgi:hypothetical protein
LIETFKFQKEQISKAKLYEEKPTYGLKAENSNNSINNNGNIFVEGGRQSGILIDNNNIN